MPPAMVRRSAKSAHHELRYTARQPLDNRSLSKSSHPIETKQPTCQATAELIRCVSHSAPHALITNPLLIFQTGDETSAGEKMADADIFGDHSMGSDSDGTATPVTAVSPALGA
jgi:hypothetical protein